MLALVQVARQGTVLISQNELLLELLFGLVNVLYVAGVAHATSSVLPELLG